MGMVPRTPRALKGASYWQVSMRVAAGGAWRGGRQNWSDALHGTRSKVARRDLDRNGKIGGSKGIKEAGVYRQRVHIERLTEEKVVMAQVVMVK